MAKKEVAMDISKNSAPASQPWYDGTRYKCGLCQNEFKDTDSLGHHLRKTHKKKSSSKVYQDSFIVVKKSFHKCKICHREVMRNRHVIRTHMRNNHMMTFLEYESKFHLNSAKRFIEDITITREDMDLLEKADAAEEQKVQ